MFEEAIEYGGNTGILIAVIVVVAICTIGGLLMSGVNFLRSSQKTVTEIKEDHAKKVLEEQAKETRIAKLEGWTGRQQKDIKRVTEAITVIMIALRAILKHIIDNTGANGDCHRALESIDKYIGEKMNQTESQ